MKKPIIIIIFLSILTVNTAKAWDLNNLLPSNGSNSGSVIGSIGQAIQNATATQNFDLNSLVGTWKYVSPGVAFKSDNVAGKLTGTAASTTIEHQLAPYYSKAGVTNLVLTVDSNLNFTMKMSLATLKGTITRDSSGRFFFNFKAFGKINLGKIECMAVKSGSQLNLTFDAKRLIQVAETVSSITKSSTFSTVTSILKAYDGIYIGVKLQKQ